MNLKLSLSSRRVTRNLLMIVIGLVVMSLLSRLALAVAPHSSSMLLLTNKFYLDEEANFPSLYSSLALAFASGLLFLIAQCETAINATYSRSWRILSGIFLYLAIDELISIHELAMIPFQKMGFRGFLHYAWVVPAMVVMIFVIASFFKFLLNLNPQTRFRFVLAGGLFLLGAIGFEMLDGKVVDHIGEEAALLDPLYQVLMTIEEGLEMTGIMIFIHALLSYLNQYHGVRELSLSLPVIRSMPIYQAIPMPIYPDRPIAPPITQPEFAESSAKSISHANQSN